MSRQALKECLLNSFESEENKMEKPKAYTMLFSKIYPLYVNKAVKKGRTQDEVNEIIFWLTGYNEDTLQQQINSEVDLETFFNQAPHFNPNAVLIKGSICGCRVEKIEDDVLRKIRYLDKLVDELAKGKSMTTILRKE